MNTIETIQQKIVQLPPQAQAEVLALVEQIERRYQPATENLNDEAEAIHPLTLIARLSVDVGVSDFAERHDFYAHGKLED
jgi:hypothetical protein